MKKIPTSLLLVRKDNEKESCRYLIDYKGTYGKPQTLAEAREDVKNKFPEWKVKKVYRTSDKHV